jgi:hypothetical protein
VYWRGEAHAANGAVSSEHSKVDPVSVAENVKVADVLAVRPFGPESIVVSGGVTSTVQEWVAGVGSVFPARSVARTSKVWDPSARSA